MTEFISNESEFKSSPYYSDTYDEGTVPLSYSEYMWLKEEIPEAIEGRIILAESVEITHPEWDGNEGMAVINWGNGNSTVITISD